MRSQGGGWGPYLCLLKHTDTSCASTPTEEARRCLVSASAVPHGSTDSLLFGLPPHPGRATTRSWGSRRRRAVGSLVLPQRLDHKLPVPRESRAALRLQPAPGRQQKHPPKPGRVWWESCGHVPEAAPRPWSRRSAAAPLPGSGCPPWPSPTRPTPCSRAPDSEQADEQMPPQLKPLPGSAPGSQSGWGGLRAPAMKREGIDSAEETLGEDTQRPRPRGARCCSRRRRSRGG